MLPHYEETTHAARYFASSLSRRERGMQNTYPLDTLEEEEHGGGL